jgi:glycine/D-amino acid oxidase-like deaminating enzyme
VTCGTGRPSLYLAGNVLDAKGLAREVKQRQGIGLASEYLDRRTLRHHFGTNRPAALLNHGNAETNPVELAAGYLRLALKAGAHFHAPHAIVDIDCDRRGTTLETTDGIRIHARHVVFCQKLHGIFPDLDSRAVVSWTGSFGGSSTGMPTEVGTGGYTIWVQWLSADLK